MRKIVVYLLSCLLVLGSIIPVMAEEDFGDTSAWITKCSSSDLTDEEKKQCAAFSDKMAKESDSLRQELEKIESRRETIKNEINKYGKEIATYEAQIKKLGAEIASLNEQISVKEQEIIAKEQEIAAKEAEIEALKQKVMDRMVASQSSMRLNQYIDIIMGAKDLNDLVRRTNGINDITNYDESEREKLKNLIDELNVAKAELIEVKAGLEADKESVKAKQNEILIMQKTAQIAMEEAKKMEADLEAQGNKIAGNLEGIKAALSAISANIDNIPNSSGFTRPTAGGRITAGTWHYPASFGGGVHLGADFAPGRGATIRAAGNGIVVKSVDGCGEGYLTNSCGAAQGGSSGGGNQIYLLTRIDGVLYAVKYLHMEAGSPIAQNTIVNAGDAIGRVGNSGNSSGPHCHVEVFKLGSMTINEYIASWNGDLAFGTGWGSAGLNTTCENRGAPCRVRPETVF